VRVVSEHSVMSDESTPAAHRLAKLVKQASAANTSLDVPGILWLEHINLQVGDRAKANAFYGEFLGFTRDPSPSWHYNLGSQQFHLQDGTTHVIHGSIGITVRSLDALRGRRDAASQALAGSRFAVADHTTALTVTCPFGNTFHVYELAAPPPIDVSLPVLAQRHAGWDDGMAVRGKPGIRFLHFRVPAGVPKAAHHIGAFYHGVFGCVPITLAADTCAVAVGPGVHLVFADDDVSEAEVAAMSGVHVAIYIERFREAYDRLSRDGLIWTNPRFARLDTCDTWEEAARCRQFRFRHIIDSYHPPIGWHLPGPLGPGEQPLLELEHETRAVRHFQFYKDVPFDG
jgi:catechol 2,3-dioxygenase-like lactoylglutathione lyase family enzyme